jgi:hypothetical protein
MSREICRPLRKNGAPLTASGDDRCMVRGRHSPTLCELLSGANQEKTPGKHRSAARERDSFRAPGQRPFLASRSDGVPRTSQAVLGTPLLGQGLLLHHKRHHHRRCHTSVYSIARTYRRQPVVIQFFGSIQPADHDEAPGRWDSGVAGGEVPPHDWHR